MNNKQKSKDILNYVLDCFDIKRFVYVGQKKNMLKEIEFMINSS